MKIVSCAVVALLGFIGAASASVPKPTAVFPIGFDDTSLQGQEQGPQSNERTRLAELDKQLHDGIAGSGCCAILDLPPGAGDRPGIGLPSCDGCEVDVARQVHAVIAVTGWVQKVSNLILNINVVARDIVTGKVIAAGSVDIRGNTDEAWSRGLSYLLRNRLHPSQW